MPTSRFNRREFMGLTGAGLLAGAHWPVAAAAADLEPDLIVVNAKVYTVDQAAPRAEAFAVRAGRFLAVGGTDEIKALAGRSTQTFDARQMTVVPGLIDAHNHAPGPIL